MASAANTQFYVDTVNTSGGILSVANPNLNGSGTTVQIFATTGVSAARVDYIHVQAIGATTVGMVRIFVKKNSGAIYLLSEIAVEAVTPSGSVKAWAADYYPSVPTFNGPSPLNLNIGDSLIASTQNGENFTVAVFGANY